jgi:hypothetical protein
MVRYSHVRLCVRSGAMTSTKCWPKVADASSSFRGGSAHETTDQGHRQRSNAELPGSASIAGIDCQVG